MNLFIISTYFSFLLLDFARNPFLYSQDKDSQDSNSEVNTYLHVEDVDSLRYINADSYYVLYVTDHGDL